MSRRKSIARILAICCAPLAVSGCAGIEVLHESAYCPGAKERQALVVRDQAALGGLWQSLRNAPETGAAPSVDFRNRRILFLADAEKPTAGYRLRLASPTLTVNMGVASLRLESAAPGGMTAQVITRPCLLLALPGGDYQRIEATDQTGQVWATAVPAD
jgi:hypothetical protein